MRNLIKKIISPLLKKVSKVYLSKPRKYTYNNISVWVEPTVFPPFLTISTKLLLEFIDETLPLKSKTLLELGCGCGIISILSVKKGAIVTATDINEIALNALVNNAEKNQVQIEIIDSNLFEKLQERSFDYIIINPPYYPKKPNSIAEKAWYCGENFEYFEQSFFELPKFTFSNNEIYMILSEDCELEKIKSIALKNKIDFELIIKKKVIAEKNYIFRLRKIQIASRL